MSELVVQEGARYLVTGGAGFIGSHLCERLIQDGARVVAVDNLVTGSRDNLRGLLRSKDFEFIEHDICEPREWQGGFAGVFHLACPASPVDYARLPLETLRVGSAGTWCALQIALEKDCPFLLASTSEVYGDPLVHPQPETYWGNVNPIGPRSCYDEAKRFSESVTMAFHRVHGVRTRIVRIFNTYGPRMRLEDGRVVPNFCVQALKNEPLTVYGRGTQTRSFCYVSDLVDGLVRAFHNDYALPINLGNPQELTIREFADRIRACAAVKLKVLELPLPQDDPKTRRPDITLARELLGWEPKVVLDDGLKATYEDFRSRLGSKSEISPMQ